MDGQEVIDKRDGFIPSLFEDILWLEKNLTKQLIKIKSVY
jgi:hypothetical protein